MSASRLSVAMAVIIATVSVWSFPLDPVRIHYRGRFVNQDREILTRSQEILASVWQGGNHAVDSGTLLFEEKTTVTPDNEGYFQLWLGAGEIVHGELKGSDFGLDKTLFIQIELSGEKSWVVARAATSAIDDAYISMGGNLFKPVGEEPIKHGREYRPEFTVVTPDMVRRGSAILYPDGRIQRVEGSFLETTGSTTSGVQELFDYCAREHVDGYIVGGSVPRGQQVVYQVRSPLRIHPAQGFRLDTGAICLDIGEATGMSVDENLDEPGLTIDSCMMADIRLNGIILYRGRGYALAVHPQNLLPLDSFVGPTIVDTNIHVTTIACRGAGGVEFNGSINFSGFSFNEINHGGIGVHVDPGASFSNNRFTCKHIHNQQEANLLVEAGFANIWEVNLNCDARDPRGVVTEAANDLWFANITTRNQPAITLGEKAAGNQFHLMGVQGSLVNDARVPTNRFYASANNNSSHLPLGFSAETPGIPESGVPVVNRHPFQVVVLILKPGTVSSWGLTDTHDQTQRVVGGLTAGQSILLSPGEAISFEYNDEKPAWRWRTLQ